MMSETNKASVQSVVARHPLQPLLIDKNERCK
jgi:hypothetical protein